MAEWLERQLCVHYSIDCGIESVYGAYLLLSCLCLALFFADASLFPRCRRVAGAPSHLAGRRVAAGGWLQAGGCRQTGGFWQTGGCRQTGRGRRAEPRGAVVCKIFWLAGAAVRVAGLAAATVGSGAVGSSGWRSCLVYCTVLS